MKQKITAYIGKKNLKEWQDKKREELFAVLYKDKGRLEDWMLEEHPPIKVTIEIPEIKEKKSNKLLDVFAEEIEKKE